MKYAIIIPDGMADEPQDGLQGQTPLEAARIPAMDAVARAGVVGRSSNVPAHLAAGSAVATMSLLGYDPNENFTGRAPLEAAAQGIELGPEDWAIRCNLVTIEDQIMRDFTAGHSWRWLIHNWNAHRSAHLSKVSSSAVISASHLDHR